MTRAFTSTFNNDSPEHAAWNSVTRDDAIDAELYRLQAQHIASAARGLVGNWIPARNLENTTHQYLTGTPSTAVNHQIAEINKRMAQLDDSGQAEFRELYAHHTALITRVDRLLHQVENQNAAILELSRIIDELKQDSFQPLEPLEDVD